MNFLIITSIIIQLSGESRATIHAKWKHYPDVALEECGIGFKSSVAEHSCFEWHRNVDNANNKQALKNIRNGRNAITGEFPWIVYITVRMAKANDATCTGSLINRKWIVTAAHCFGTGKRVPRSQVKVRIGSINKYESIEYEIEDYFPHPNYVDLFVSLQRYHRYYHHNYDIALVKLKRSASFNQTTDYFVTNSICLPEKFIINTEYEYATIAGFGKVDTAGNVQAILKTGAIRIVPFGKLRSLDTLYEDSKIFVIDYNGDDIMAYMNDTNYPISCKGDSGAPVFQYYNGRAVLIGVIGNSKTADIVSYHYCKPEIAIIVRLSKKIDWILRTIRNSGH